MALNLNSPEHPDDGLLEDAREAASTDWEEEFVAGLIILRKKYGETFRLTEKAREILNQIAGND